MEIFGSIRSRAFRALWAAEEAGIEYQHREVDFRKGEHHSPEFLKINPCGKVPALVDGDLCLFESAAICSYLAEHGNTPSLIPPAGSRHRALYDQWMFFISSELEQGLWTMGKHRFALPAERRIAGMIEVGAWEYGRAARVLDQGLGDRPYLVGDGFTMVDVMAGHTLLWARYFEVPLGSPRLERYLEALEQRPAFQKIQSQRKDP